MPTPARGRAGLQASGADEFHFSLTQRLSSHAPAHTHFPQAAFAALAPAARDTSPLDLRYSTPSTWPAQCSEMLHTCRAGQWLAALRMSFRAQGGLPCARFQRSRSPRRPGCSATGHKPRGLLRGGIAGETGTAGQPRLPLPGETPTVLALTGHQGRTAVLEWLLVPFGRGVFPRLPAPFACSPLGGACKPGACALRARQPTGSS